MRYVNLKKTKRKKKKPKKASWLVLLIIIAGAYLFFSRGLKLDSLLSPISVFSKIVNPSGLKESDGRVNVLLLGVDTRNDRPSATLTDTILVASIATDGSDAYLISIPRDLWVPLSQSMSGKINAAYSMGGVDLTKSKVEDVLGLPIHYHALIGFEGFEQAVDTLGGIEIEVKNTFDDYYYPIPGKENDTCGIEKEEIKEGEEATQSAEKFYPCRYNHLHFDKGLQVMDGETALRYARSRKAAGVEGGDFARSKRQQQVILAAKDKLLSLKTLTNPTKVKGLYDTYREYVETDISFTEAERFWQISQKSGQMEIETITIDKDTGLIISPADRSFYGGQAVLLPKTGEFSQIHAFVQKKIFE